MSEDPDEPLVLRAQSGDPAAREELCRKYRDRLVTFTTRLLFDEEEDVAQEALATALDKLPDFRRGSRFSTWLFGIAVNLCRARIRSRREQPLEGARMEAALERSRSVLSSIIRRETADRLAAAIAELPTILREAFILRFVEGMEYSEIAQIVEASEGTARVRAHRARALLQDELGPEFRLETT